VAARGRRTSGTARLLVLVGILTVLGVTFVAGVYAGRIWSARAAVVAARVPDGEPARRPPGRGGRMADPPGPQLTFYQELTAPLTAPPPLPRPPKTAPPPLVTTPPAVPLPAPAPAARAQHPGEQADVLAAARGAASGPRFTLQVAAYRVRPPADALRETLASAGHEARVVEADAHGPVYRVQVGEFATREEARAAAERLAAERSSVTPFVTTR
jgi:cell division protein FtsN